LLAPKHQQFGVGGQNFAYRILELAAGIHTLRRTCSIHCLGIRATRFLPCAINVSDQAGCPSPDAQWQVGFPQRV
jgi:hypothetical protein